MRTFFKMNYRLLCTALAGMLVLQSCDDDETFDVRGVAENKVYLNTQSWAPITAPVNTASFAVVNTPLGALVQNADKVEMKFPVHATHSSSTAVQVQLAIDKTLVTEGYLAVPDAVPISFSNSTLTIPSGATSSADSVSISIATADLPLLAPGTYLIPVKISSATNAQVSENLQMAYVLITTKDSNIQSGAGVNDIQGSLISTTGWSGIVNHALVSGSAASMFTPQTNQYWRVDSGNNPFDFEVDMTGEQSSITGLRFHTNNQAYNILRLAIESSVDGDTWTSHGEGELSFGTNQYVKFYQPFDARYLRITVLGRRHASQLRMARFEVYTNPG